MSRVFKKRGAWYADWADENGNRHRKSLKGIETRDAARSLLAEIVASANRRALGLDPTAVSTTASVWDLCDWWLKYRCPEPSKKKERNRLESHVRDSALGRARVTGLRRIDVDKHLALLEGQGLSAASVNHVRGKLRTIFNKARHAEMFGGLNPVDGTQHRRVAKRFHATLSVDEVPQMLRFVDPSWRPFFAGAVYMALRKGELAGALKTDVDLVTGTLHVRHSYRRATTKGGHEDLLPIPAPMLPYVEAALKTPGPWLFPDKNGRMHGPECDPHLRLRSALAKAGIVDGYRVTCRWCTRDSRPQPFDVKQLHPARPNLVCPTHKLAVWVTAVPRHLRFHDLRHTAATLLLRAGVDMHRVQRILRHANVTTTTGTYGHLLVEDLRASMTGAYGTEKFQTENRETGKSATSDAAPTEAGNAENDSEKRSAPRGIRTPDPRLRRPMR